MQNNKITERTREEIAELKTEAIESLQKIFAIANIDELTLEHVNFVDILGDIYESAKEAMLDMAKEKLKESGWPTKSGGREYISNGLRLLRTRPRGQKVVTDWSRVPDALKEIKLRAGRVDSYIKENDVRLSDIGIVEETIGEGSVKAERYEPKPEKPRHIKGKVENPLKDINFKKLSR